MIKFITPDYISLNHLYNTIEQAVDTLKLRLTPYCLISVQCVPGIVKIDWGNSIALGSKNKQWG